MSRAFGNRMLKQFVVAEPEIQVFFKININFPVGIITSSFFLLFFFSIISCKQLQLLCWLLVVNNDRIMQRPFSD